MPEDIPIEVQIKLEAAKQCEISMQRLKGYEYMFKQIKDGHVNIVIPKEVFKRFQDWTESQIIIERTNILSYAK